MCSFEVFQQKSIAVAFASMQIVGAGTQREAQ